LIYATKEAARDAPASTHRVASIRSPFWSTAARAQLTRQPDAVVVAGVVAAPERLRATVGSTQKRTGPDGTIDDKHNHPVVHVAHENALVYARWLGRSSRRMRTPMTQMAQSRPVR
jgi:Sulfatase-modifying factor enzyme 1